MFREKYVTTITVDDQTHATLQANANERVMTLLEYLRVIAPKEGLSPKSQEDARQEELHRRMQQIIDEAAHVVLEPNRP